MANTGRLRYREIDQNPGSPTFGQERWGPWVQDAAACPPETLYDSVAISGFTRKNDCGPGLVGTEVYFVVAAGYARSGTQAEADAEAQTHYENTRQSYANALGECVAEGAKQVTITDYAAETTRRMRVTATRTDTAGELTLQLLFEDGAGAPDAYGTMVIPDGQTTATEAVGLTGAITNLLAASISSTSPTGYIF